MISNYITIFDFIYDICLKYNFVCRFIERFIVLLITTILHPGIENSAIIGLHLCPEQSCYALHYNQGRLPKSTMRVADSFLFPKYL